MGIKDLFDNEERHEKSLQNVNVQDLTAEDDVESGLFLQAYKEDKKRFVPDLDYSDPKNFARYGSAEKYYVDGIKNICTTYPYDLSLIHI